jgi:hypothetical protein
LNPIDVKKTLRHITKKRAYEEKKGFNWKIIFVPKGSKI